MADEEDELAGALEIVVGAIKRKAAGSEGLQQELERLLKKRKQAPEVEKAKALFGTPPSRTNANNFALKYGLVRVHGSRPPYDQFRDLDLKMRPLKAVHLLVSSVVGKAIRTRGDPSGELKRQGIHELILSQFREFTSPRAKAEVDVYNEDEEETPISPSAAGAGNVRPEQGNTAGEADEHEDLFIDAIDFDDEEHERDDNSEEEECEDTKTPTTNSNKSHFVDAQGQNEEERKGRERFDLIAKVYKDNRLEERLAVDFKTEARSEHVLQAATYVIGFQSRTSGLSNDYRPPVCLQVWDKKSWFYGYIEIDEFIGVEDEEIVEETLARFPKTVAESIASCDVKKRTRAFTQSYVRKEFAKWKAELKRQGMKVLDGKYPVGRLFMDKQVRAMPTFVGEDVELSKGARRFYEGMLKTLVGKHVTKWTSKHVYKAYHRRKEVLDLVNRLCIPKDDWCYVPGLKGELDCVPTWVFYTYKVNINN